MNVIDLDGDMKKHGFNSNIIELEEYDFGKLMPNPQTHIEYADKLVSKVEGWIAK